MNEVATILNKIVTLTSQQNFFKWMDYFSVPIEPFSFSLNINNTLKLANIKANKLSNIFQKKIIGVVNII